MQKCRRAVRLGDPYSLIYLEGPAFLYVPVIIVYIQYTYPMNPNTYFTALLLSLPHESNYCAYLCKANSLHKGKPLYMHIKGEREKAGSIKEYEAIPSLSPCNPRSVGERRKQPPIHSRIVWRMAATTTGHRPKEYEMQDTISATFKGSPATVKELTVKQVREIFERLDKDRHLFIDDLLDQPVPALAVSESTGIPLDQLEDAKPSEVIALCMEVVRVNPSSASMIRRRIEAAERLEKIILSERNSTGPSAH